MKYIETFAPVSKNVTSLLEFKLLCLSKSMWKADKIN